jgi:hypothetical protein
LIFRIVQVQFVCLIILLLCNGIAGRQNAAFWYALITVTILVLTVAARIARRLR